jgi:uncharacterized phage protein (TIGR01671 family)
MREIKFRALSKNGNWYYSDDEVYFLKSCNGKLYLFEDESFYNDKNFTYALIGEAKQYTGLNDKQGVEIYEGDIVKTQVWTKINEGNSSGDWYIGEILFSNGCFYGHFPKPEVMEYLQFFRYEVIGNIYENPELLEMK